MLQQAHGNSLPATLGCSYSSFWLKVTETPSPQISWWSRGGKKLSLVPLVLRLRAKPLVNGSVLLSAGTVIFPPSSLDRAVLWFQYRIILIRHWCFSWCWAELTPSQGLGVPAVPVRSCSRSWDGAWPGELIPLGYPTPGDATPRVGTGQWPGRAEGCWGRGWASLGGGWGITHCTGITHLSALYSPLSFCYLHFHYYYYYYYYYIVLYFNY